MLAFRSLLVAALIAASTTTLVAQRFGAPTPSPGAVSTDPFLGHTTQSVLVADFDGDGHRDLAFGNQNDGGQILLSDGAWRFVPRPGAFPGPSGRVLADAGDIDGDGDIDLLVLQGGVAYTLTNGGAAIFGTPVPLPGSYPAATCAVFIDFDGDGDLDVVVGYNLSLIRAFRNNGGGQFVETTATVMPFYNGAARVLAVADVDGDGDSDLILGANGQPELLRNDAGVFTRVTPTHMPQLGVAARTLAVGDVDGDGDVDIVIGVDYTTSSATNLLFINDGSGHFTDESAARLPAWSAPMVTFVDVDADGDLDLVLGTARAQLQVFANDGSGHFLNATSSFVGELMPSVTALAVGDLDNDGRKDLIIGAEPVFWAPEPYGRNVLLQNQPGGFVERFSPTDEPWGGMLPMRTMSTNSVTLVDYDHDGDLDLLYGNDYGHQNRLYRNDGNGVFTEVTRTALPADATNTVEVAVGDVNGDGFEDLVLACYDGQNMLYFGTAASGFVQATWGRMPLGTYHSISVALGDLDGDGDLDIVFGIDGQSRIYRNNGNGVFQDFTSYWMPILSEPTRSVKLVDLDGDGDLDILAVVANYYQNGVSLRAYWNNGSGIMATTTPLPAATPVWNAVPGDFTGDGLIDVFTSNFGPGGSSGTGTLLRNVGGGNFVASGSFLTSGNEGQMVAADIDGDGDLDVVASSRPVCQTACAFGGTRVYRNTGSGAFTVELLQPVDDCGRGIAAGDIDGDGDVDLVVGNRFFVQGAAQWGYTLGQSRLYPNNTRQVTVTGAPQLGTSQSVVTTSLPASATGPLLLVSFVGFSLVPTPLPTPFGMLRLDPANVVLLPGTATATSLASPLAIPNVPALNGARLYFQSLVEGRDLHGNPELRLTNAMGETLRP